MNSSLVLLKACGSQVEASMVRSLLDANGITYVVRGENHNALLGPLGGGAIIELGVLVAQRDLEPARALLASQVMDAGSAGPGSATPGAVDTAEAVCPVHGERSTAVCGRCGTFLCARCGTQASASPLCEDCAGRKEPGSQSRRSHRRKVLWTTCVVAFVLMLLLLGLPL